MTATCASSCPTPTAPKASCATRPTGWPAGPASASIRAIRRPGPKPRSAGGRRAARTRRQKLVIFSDGLDVDKIEELHRQFAGRVKVSFGWGTMLTNDFRGLVDGDALAPVQPGLQGGLAPTAGPRSSCRTTRTRRWARRTRSRATSASSASARRSPKRCWCRAGFTPPPPRGHHGASSRQQHLGQPHRPGDVAPR